MIQTERVSPIAHRRGLGCLGTSHEPGPLDLTNVANWTLGEHTIEFKETGGAGVTKATSTSFSLYRVDPPVNDTCETRSASISQRVRS